jgi:hypothetical protein
MQEWITLVPEVDNAREFLEIAGDFAKPLEAVREAISNSYDWNAKNIYITFSVETIEGQPTLILQFRDDGAGMSRNAISSVFWGLGKSEARGDIDKIGEKGHGTKIFLRSEKVIVRTAGPDGSYEAECERPFRDLASGKLHNPKWRSCPAPDDGKTFTEITLQGFNNNARAQFTQPIVKDYILWFSKAGSIETSFKNRNPREINVHLKCLGKDSYEELKFGHPFPEEESDLEKLFKRYESDAADYFVKKYVQEDGNLKDQPEVHYQAIIYVEGDKAKRAYNPMIKKNIRARLPGYRVSDRYGIWLCKDFIPIQRVNEWISGFGSGSNAFVLLHGFINCQSLSLTANRGNFANTDQGILDGLKEVVTEIVTDIDKDIIKNNLFTLMNWQEEARTLDLEKADFKKRTELAVNNNYDIIEDICVYEPRNEAELFGLFMQIYGKKPELFNFEPIDYSINRGIDLLAKRKTPGRVGESPYGYIELKYKLSGDFNHSFKNLRWIICWDFSPDCRNGSALTSKVEKGERKLIYPENGEPDLYFLDDPRGHTKVQIIRMKNFLAEKLNLRFEKKAGLPI